MQSSPLAQSIPIRSIVLVTAHSPQLPTSSNPYPFQGYVDAWAIVLIVRSLLCIPISYNSPLIEVESLAS
jgi:hypothetical protein